MSDNTTPAPDGLYVIRPPDAQDEAKATKAESSAENPPTTEAGPAEAASGQPGQPQGLDVVCAFTVALGHDGHWLMIPDPSVALMVRRPPQQWDFIAAFSSLLVELQVALTTQSVVQGQIQMAGQLRQQLEGQQMAAQLFGPDGKMRRH